MLGYLKLNKDYEIIVEGYANTEVGGHVEMRRWPWLVRIINHDWYSGITGSFYEIDIVKETGNVRFKWHTTSVKNKRIQEKLLKTQGFQNYLGQIIGSIMMDCNSLIENGQVDMSRIDDNYRRVVDFIESQEMEQKTKEHHQATETKNINATQNAGDMSERKNSHNRRMKSNHSGGKGDQRRQSQVSGDTFSDNWDRSFNKK